MAEADAIPVQTFEGVVLKLSMAETRTLFSILQVVGGSPERSPRKHIAEISDAIETALGMKNYDWDWVEPEMSYRSGRIAFEDYAG